VQDKDISIFEHGDEISATFGDMRGMEDRENRENDEATDTDKRGFRSIGTKIGTKKGIQAGESLKIARNSLAE